MHLLCGGGRREEFGWVDPRVGGEDVRARLLWPRMVGVIVGAVLCATSAHALTTRTGVQPSAYPAREGPLLPTGTRVSIRLLDSVKGDRASIGTAAEVAGAFRAAGWTDVAGSSVRADYETLVATAEARGFAAQPVSTLELDGVPPRLAFEKVVNSMARRHHLRIWPWGGATGGRELWPTGALPPSKR